MKLSKKVHRSFHIFLAFVFGVWTLSCSTPSSQKPQQLTFFANLPQFSAVSETQIPYPIILLHGLGQKAEVWNDANAVKFYAQDLGLGFGGTIKFSQGVPQLLDNSASKTSDFFTVSFSSPYDSIGGWARELRKAIDIVRTTTKSDKVILIGYSMGGVAARYHLILQPINHHVKRLITIGSPHQGSAFAKAYNWKTSINEGLADNPNFVKKLALDAAKGTLETLETGVPFDAPAVGDLRLPHDGGRFLFTINRLPHPGDVEYVSVVGRVEFLEGVASLRVSTFSEILRRGLEVLGQGGTALLRDGDGVVSAQSQNISELPWFTMDRNRQKIARTITLQTEHLQHLKSSNEIQRVTLEEQPELKGADFYKINDKGALVIDFIDYLPAYKTSVKVTVQKKGIVVFTKEIPKEKISLVRKKDGRVVLRAILEYPQNDDWNEELTFDYTITNSFGNSVNSSKVWEPNM